MSGPALVDPLPVEPLSRPPDADVVLPGSKSYTNRALICAALAEGTSRLERALEAEDTDAMVGCLRTLGVAIDHDRDRDTLVVGGTGGRFAAGAATLLADQSGTTARFVAPILALGEDAYRLDGAAQLRARPMSGLIDALRQLGVHVTEEGEPGRLPMSIKGGVVGSIVRLAGDVTSQFLSGLLMAGRLYPEGLRIELTTPLVSRPYARMTASTMAAFGGGASVSERWCRVEPGTYEPCDYVVEPDASAASYFFALAAMTGGRVRVDGLRPTSAQGDVGFVDVLERMGVDVARDPLGITVTGVGGLTGVDIDLRDMSDSAPTFAVVAAMADTPSRARGIGFIREKESDRIAAVVTELRRLGIDAAEEADGFVVRPGAAFVPATVDTYDDHRMAMAFALLGLIHPGISIADPGCVAKTFPGYWDALNSLRR